MHLNLDKVYYPRIAANHRCERSLLCRRVPPNHSHFKRWNHHHRHLTWSWSQLEIFDASEWGISVISFPPNKAFTVWLLEWFVCFANGKATICSLRSTNDHQRLLANMRIQSWWVYHGYLECTHTYVYIICIYTYIHILLYVCQAWRSQINSL